MRRILNALAIVATVSSQALAQTGSIAGTVKTGGSPLANARAVLDTTREIRTDSTGRFQFRDVAAGRHSLVVLAIGATPYSANVIVPAGDTLDFDVVLVKTVVLDSVVVEGSTVRQGFVRAFEDRKRVGMGRFLDSTEVRKFAGMTQALSFVTGVKKRNDKVFFSDSFGALCDPNVWIDSQNWGIDQETFRVMRPDDVVAVEVYTRSALIPDEFKTRGFEKGCGALVVWTKRFWPQGRGKP